MSKQRRFSLYSARDAEREKSATNPAKAFRSEYRRDFARLIHCPAFRRLQGKTQLFPSAESEFFRNRLTHSLEVAQIAKGIAAKLNDGAPGFSTSGNSIDLDIVETAALAHDLGHPPFGHIGEAALDRLMYDDGGFEGNAQTLRILTRLEKKESWRDPFDSTGRDTRLGLNLTYRTLAAVLKYDQLIPHKGKDRKKKDGVYKGFYGSEEQLVSTIKTKVRRTPLKKGEKFKTVECRIMDVADDIAYSTYDLEDTLKAGFITPLEITAAASDIKLLGAISKEVTRNIGASFTPQDVIRVLLSIFSSRGLFDPRLLEGVATKGGLHGDRAQKVVAAVTINTFQASNRVSTDGHERTKLTSSLVDSFMSGVRARWNRDNPALSDVWLDPPVLEQVEVLKHYTFAKLIKSPRIKLVEFRGTEIVSKIFDSLASERKRGFELLPDDYRHVYESATNASDRRRVVCDFVAGMTDRYAYEFYDRLTSSSPETFFKPH